VLVTPDPKATGPTAQALRIIAMKQSDLALSSRRIARTGSGWA